MAEIAFTTDGALLNGADDVLVLSEGRLELDSPITVVSGSVFINALINDSIGQEFIIDTRIDGGDAIVLINDNAWNIFGSSRVFVNGSEVFHLDTFTEGVNNIEILLSSVTISQLLTRETNNVNFSGAVCCVRIVDEGSTVLEYIKNGDYGATELIDHSGNSNDGTYISATWGKIRNGELVEFWDDWELYLAQLPVTPVEFQNCTRIDVDTPNTGDAQWLAYSDPMWLVVNDQSSGLATYTYRTNLRLNLALEL